MPTREKLLPPAAARTIEGLRDTGYEPTTAVADIVDNSVAAGATVVNIRLWMELDGQLVLSISDNGVGMDDGELENAMTYGSQLRANAASLGKFGLGLKTASTSVCRQFTVVSRKSDGPGAVAAQWDLDVVEKRNEWVLLRPDPSAQELPLLDEAAAGGHGTLVVWRKIDRLLPTHYQNPTGGAAQAALQRIKTQLREHLALTFLRFLDGTAGEEPLTLLLDGTTVEPWDPFALGEKVFEREVPVQLDGADASFTVRAFVLPPTPDLSDEQRQLAQINTDNQGFYVFRENRLISSGNWLGMFSIEPHLNLCRVDFSFDHRLDDALHIDIKKSRIRMLADLQDKVKQLIAPARAEAQTRYRSNQRTRAVVEGPAAHETSNKMLDRAAGKLSLSTVTVDGPGLATVRNSKGQVQIQVPTLDADDVAGPRVVVVPDIEDGLLWRPGLVGSRKGVLLNAGHPFYQRIYEAAQGGAVTAQGMDFLFWSLCEAELATLEGEERDFMEGVRFEVSRILRRLATELPEPTSDFE